MKKIPPFMRGDEFNMQTIGLKSLIVDLKGDNMIMAEIGVYAGESTKIFAESNKFKTIYCIDPWLNGYDETDPASQTYPMQDVESDFDIIYKQFHSIVPLKVTGEIAGKQFPPLFFNFVYIDANHEYKNVVQDIQIYCPLIKSGGALAGHDYGGCNRGRDVGDAVDKIFGKPDKLYQDGSWIKWL